MRTRHRSASCRFVMKPLAQYRSFMLTLVILETSWGFQTDHRSSSSPDQRPPPTTIETENIEDLWYDVIKKKSNKVQANILHRNQSDVITKSNSDDMNKLIDVLAELRPSSNRSKAALGELRRAIIKNSRGGIVGESIQGVFRNYCGPGNDGELNTLFPEVDACCRDHDYCPDGISAFTWLSEYQKQYPGLPYKHRLFTSLSCECDVNFFNCLKTTNSWLAEVMLGAYSIVQSSCFAYDYKIVKCSKYDEWVEKFVVALLSSSSHRYSSLRHFSLSLSVH